MRIPDLLPGTRYVHGHEVDKVLTMSAADTGKQMEASFTGISGEIALTLKFSRNRWKSETLESMRKTVAAKLEVPMLCIKFVHPDGTLMHHDEGRKKLGTLELQQPAAVDMP